MMAYRAPIPGQGGQGGANHDGGGQHGEYLLVHDVFLCVA